MLKFTDQWLLRVGASQDWFHTNNFNNKSVRTTQYVDHGVSRPAVSSSSRPLT